MVETVKVWYVTGGAASRSPQKTSSLLLKVWYVTGGAATRSPQKTSSLLLKTKLGRKLTVNEFDERRKSINSGNC